MSLKLIYSAKSWISYEIMADFMWNPHEISKTADSSENSEFLLVFHKVQREGQLGMSADFMKSTGFHVKASQISCEWLSGYYGIWL